MILRSETFPVRNYEVDASGVLAPAALAGYLIELAVIHADELGFGFADIFPRGYTWVLSRMRVAVERPIALGEVVTLDTWPSGVERLFAKRDYRARGADGQPVLRASSQWLLLNLETRRAVFPNDVIADRIPPPGPHVFEEPFVRLPSLGEGELAGERRFDTRYQDIDRNLHVTSASYVAWAVEAIPLETWQSSRLSFLEVHYMAECHHPSTIVSRSRTLGEGRFLHSIVREGDQKELARLETGWIAR